MYAKDLVQNLNDIENLLIILKIWWCLFSIVLIYCSDEWEKNGKYDLLLPSGFIMFLDEF